MTVLACAVAGLVVGAYLPGVVSRAPAGQAAFVGGFGPREQWGARGALPVVLATPVVFGLLAARLGPVPELPAYLYLGAVGVALAVIDLECRRLPDSLTLPSYAVGIGLLGLAALVRGDSDAALRALGGMAALFAFYFLLALVNPAGMGYGDVKLSGVLGLHLGWLGWDEVLLGTFVAFLLSALTGLGLIAAGRATLKSALPFGPFMLAGALVAVLWGNS